MLRFIPFQLMSFTQESPAKQCFAPNGTASDIAIYGNSFVIGSLFRCPPGDDGFATCCHDEDFCHPDNLCYNENNGSPTVYRLYCTDQSWNSPNCSPLCRNAPFNNGSVSIPAEQPILAHQSLALLYFVDLLAILLGTPDPVC